MWILLLFPSFNKKWIISYKGKYFHSVILHFLKKLSVLNIYFYASEGSSSEYK